VVGKCSWKRNAVQTPSIPTQPVLEYENSLGLNLQDIAVNVSLFKKKKRFLSLRKELLGAQYKFPKGFSPELQTKCQNGKER